MMFAILFLGTLLSPGPWSVSGGPETLLNPPLMQDASTLAIFLNKKDLSGVPNLEGAETAPQPLEEETAPTKANSTDDEVEWHFVFPEYAAILKSFPKYSVSIPSFHPDVPWQPPNFLLS